MKIVIEIPKEFEEHFKSDRFEDSLSRIASDIESFGFQLAGRYEKETITMLRKAIKNGTPLPKHHGLIDKLELSDNIKNRLMQTAMNNTEVIMPYSKVCEDIVYNRIDTWIDEVRPIIEGSESE